ncbi:MAG: hypothetical protein RI953_1895 [Pseudomonadota bacterium]|jgi:hypothetical protein
MIWIYPWAFLFFGYLAAELIERGIWIVHWVLVSATIFVIRKLVVDSRTKSEGLETDSSPVVSAWFLLFFFLPLLLKNGTTGWFKAIAVLAVSTLWRPLFVHLWASSTFRLLLIVVGNSILAGLLLALFFPGLFASSSVVFAIVCLFSLFLLFLIPGNDSDGTESAETVVAAANLFSIFSWRFFPLQMLFEPPYGRHFRPVLLIFVCAATFVLDGKVSPLPMVGVWVGGGHIEFSQDESSSTCTSWIIAPRGFDAKIIHHWRTSVDETGQMIKIGSEPAARADDPKNSTKATLFESKNTKVIRAMKMAECLVEIEGAGRLEPILRVLP